ncbi:DUF2070 family protein [Methanopyrus sp.]
MAHLMRLSFRLPSLRDCVLGWILLLGTSALYSPHLTIYVTLTALASFVTLLLDRLAKRDVPPNRWPFVGLVYAAPLVLSVPLGTVAVSVVKGVMSTFLTFALLGTVRSGVLRVVPVLAYLVIDSLVLATLTGVHLPPLLLASLTGGTVGASVVAVVDALTLASLGIRTTDALGEFLSFKSGRDHSLHSLFKSIETRTRVRVPVRVFAFVTKNNGVKGCFVIPWIHPGPLGDVGGGDLPGRIVRRLLREGIVPLVFHSTTTHDFNPVDRREAGKIVEETVKLVHEAVDREGCSVGSAPVRGEETDSVGQILGGRLFLVLSKYPEPSDDIDAATGIALERDTGGWVADCHNSFGDPDRGRVYVFSEDFWRLMRDARRISERVKPIPRLRAGFDHVDPGLDPETGLGSGGVSVAAVEAGGARTLYVVFDSNSIVRELKEEVERTLRDLAEEVVVCTSDSHEVNPRGYNPLGQIMGRDDKRRLLKAVRRAAEGAIEDLEECEVVPVEGWVKVEVTGPGSFQRLVHSVETTRTVIRVLLPTAFLGVTLLSLLFGIRT